LGLAGLALAIALPAHADMAPLKGAQPVADWDIADIATPGRPTMESFHAGIDACRDQGCVTADNVERLAWWVARGNRLAVRLSFARADGVDGDGAHILAQSYGNIIKQDPTAFLAMARDEGVATPVVITAAVTTADGMADNRAAQADELRARRAALMRVSDPRLSVLRDQCVAGIAERIAAIGSATGGA
jgi:hypothetical protein